MPRCGGSGPIAREETVILHFNFEELSALREGARMFLEESGGEHAPVAAPPLDRVRVQDLMVRLDGDLSIETLSEQREVARALTAIVGVLRAEMESSVLAHHPGEESAVTSYFDFGHALSVLGRVERIGAEMEAVIEVVTGGEATEEIARTFVFPN